MLIRENLLLTCDHVFTKSKSQQAWVRFNYTDENFLLDSDIFELDLKNHVSHSSQLDYSLIKIKDELEQQIAEVIDTINYEEDIRLIHHPSGKPVVISDLGKINKEGEDYIEHNVYTENCSSGAPIFNKDWKVIAIHQRDNGRGVPVHAFWDKIQSYLF